MAKVTILTLDMNLVNYVKGTHTRTPTGKHLVFHVLMVERQTMKAPTVVNNVGVSWSNLLSAYRTGKILRLPL